MDEKIQELLVCALITVTFLGGTFLVFYFQSRQQERALQFALQETVENRENGLCVDYKKELQRMTEQGYTTEEKIDFVLQQRLTPAGCERTPAEVMKMVSEIILADKRGVK